MRDCLQLDAKNRPDFLGIYRRSIGETDDSKEKIRFLIQIEQMSVKNCEECFGKDGETISELREKNARLSKLVEKKNQKILEKVSTSSFREKISEIDTPNKNDLKNLLDLSKMERTNLEKKLKKVKAAQTKKTIMMAIGFGFLISIVLLLLNKFIKLF